MLETFDPISKLLNLMNALLDMADPQLRAFLDRYVMFVSRLYS
jgi:spore coat protein CotF